MQGIVRIALSSDGGSLTLLPLRLLSSAAIRHRRTGGFVMPALEFKGKQHIYAHHLTVPYRLLVLVPVAAAKEYHRRIPNGRLQIVQNCGHHPELEATHQFVGLVEGF